MSLSLASRKFVRYPSITDDGKQDGTVAVEIHVGKDGSVISARVVLRGTTITDRTLWQKCVDAVKGARLNQLETAPDEQVGRIVFNFKNN
jgi:TonB family protein